MKSPRKERAFEPNRALIAARERKFDSAAAAARALGIAEPTYMSHENGSRGIKGVALRYSKFFGVSVESLLSGAPDLRTKAPRKIRVDGYVGAGAVIDEVRDADAFPAIDAVELPGEGEIAAFIVKGDSQWPRFLDGEAILYDPKARSPGELADQYAIVQTKTDARRLIKILRRDGPDRWRLESHNAPPESGVELLAAWRYLGTLAASPLLPFTGEGGAKRRMRGR